MIRSEEREPGGKAGVLLLSPMFLSWIRNPGRDRLPRGGNEQGAGSKRSCPLFIFFTFLYGLRSLRQFPIGGMSFGNIGMAVLGEAVLHFITDASADKPFDIGLEQYFFFK